MTAFHETRLWSTPIRDLGLTIAGTSLESALAEFQQELLRVGIVRLKPDFHLSTEWGVPFGTISIGIPFYLARPELADAHAQRIGHLEGVGRPNFLRYLRHEMGHVVNYAYKLYETEDWVRQFGSIMQPYVEEYRPEPFSRRYVWHLPGWYSQKHPDEDWAETFAVWMTPGGDWRTTYADWPEALAKLQYCDRTVSQINARDPIVTTIDRDEDVGDQLETLEDYYRQQPADFHPMPGLDGALLTIFEDPGESNQPDQQRPAAELILSLESPLVASVFQWTGHFPELTRPLVRRMADRARDLNQVYPAHREREIVVALTTLVAALAMNYVTRGNYGA